MLLPSNVPASYSSPTGYSRGEFLRRGSSSNTKFLDAERHAQGLERVLCVLT